MQSQKDVKTPVRDVTDDSYHLGHVLMDFFNKPDDPIWQIDAATGEVELKSSVKSRTIQLARCLRNAGLKPGDVVVVSGVNHLDVHIPFYAGYLNGLPMQGIDPFYKYEEVKWLLNIVKPKLAICETSNVVEFEEAIKDLGLDTRIVTFGDDDKSMANFIKMYDGAPETEFRVATFDTSKVYAWLVSSSGTTGMPKVAAVRHSEVIKMVKIISTMKQKEPAPFLFYSSVQWITAYTGSLCMIAANQFKVQTSAPRTPEHYIDIINKYKPVTVVTSPSLIYDILKHETYCDMTSFKRIIITSFPLLPEFLPQLKARMRPSSVVWNAIGLTECMGGILLPAPDGPPGNCGKELPDLVPVRLVDTTTGEVITEPNKIGELWTKGPMFTEYYNNPEATATAFSPDGWFKTTDLLYRDQNGYFFFVDRMSNSYKIGSLFISPFELERVIQKHPDVSEVCVVGVPHPIHNMQSVACVLRRPGSSLTEQDVKDVVTNKLSIHKHLHGGVIFVDDFPRTFSDKIARAKVLEFVLKARKTRDS